MSSPTIGQQVDTAIAQAGDITKTAVSQTEQTAKTAVTETSKAFQSLGGGSNVTAAEGEEEVSLQRSPKSKQTPVKLTAEEQAAISEEKALAAVLAEEEEKYGPTEDIFAAEEAEAAERERAAVASAEKLKKESEKWYQRVKAELQKASRSVIEQKRAAASGVSEDKIILFQERPSQAILGTVPRYFQYVSKDAYLKSLSAASKKVTVVG